MKFGINGKPIQVPCTVMQKYQASPERDKPGKPDKHRVVLGMIGGQLTFFLNPHEEEDLELFRRCPSEGMQTILLMNVTPKQSGSHNGDTGRTYVNTTLDPILVGFGVMDRPIDEPDTSASRRPKSTASA